MAKPILLYDNIHAALAESFTEKVLEHPKDEPLSIWINGPGGSLSAGWSMLAAIHNIDNVEMTVTGDASSFYFFMLLYADKVTAFDTSNFLIHRAASMWEEIMTDEELKTVAARNKIIRKKLEARINEEKFTQVTGKTFDDIFSMDDRLDVSLTAQQAKKIGLVDKVIKLDVKKRAEIESKYIFDIAALAETKTQTINSNINKKKMGILDKVFGKNDPALLAKIGEAQFLYSNLEIGASVKVIGDGDLKPISGTFEAKDKQITVVENEITAVEAIDNKQKEIEALKTELSAIKDNQISIDDIKEIVAELRKENATEISELKAVLEKAKLTASKPKLPKGEFKDDKADNDDLTTREKIAMAQQEAYEAKLKERGN